MSFSKQDKLNERIELLGRLCNEDLDAEGLGRLNDLLTGDVEAQRQFVRYLDLQAAIRLHAQSIDDENFALLEAQTALDSSSTSVHDDTVELSEGISGVMGPQTAVSERAQDGKAVAVAFLQIVQLTRHRLAWTAAAALLLIALALATRDSPVDSSSTSRSTADASLANVPSISVANLRGTVGARWAGMRLELPEGKGFAAGERLELVEGLAEICFGGGARVILQGPAIVEIQSDREIGVSVGRIASVVPREAGSFEVKTANADLTGGDTEYGAEIDVDGSLATQVYVGEINLKFKRQHGPADAPALLLGRGQGAQVDAVTSRTTLLPQPNELHFVRYLPHQETRINLAEVVAGGNSAGMAYHRGISLADGQVVDDYGAPVVGDGKFKTAHASEFVDGVFIPDGKLGGVQVDSIGRTFLGFPPTAGDLWGGAIMARRPRYESSLPLIRLEFYGNSYGYVNWLHIASKPDEITPQGLGLIGMHSNCGITFDLHAIRARYPDKKILRFRSLVGNLESKQESSGETHTADAWVLVDGQLRHHRKSFSRENEPEAIDIQLTDRDRFLVLAVTDDGGETAYDWVAFGDAVIELTNVEQLRIAAI